jgi:hypothetical protein
MDLFGAVNAAAERVLDVGRPAWARDAHEVRTCGGQVGPLIELVRQRPHDCGAADEGEVDGRQQRREPAAAGTGHQREGTRVRERGLGACNADGCAGQTLAPVGRTEVVGVLPLEREAPSLQSGSEARDRNPLVIPEQGASRCLANCDSIDYGNQI